MTEPPACLASLPVSKLRVLPPMVSSRVVIKKGSRGSNGSKGSSGSSRFKKFQWLNRGSGFMGSSPNLSNLWNPSNLSNLFSDVQSFDQIRVSLGVLELEVI